MAEIYAVLSGKGGTGKTSVCAGIAIALAAAGRHVLCIDCDVGLRNLDISLGMSDTPALSFLDVAEGGYNVGEVTHHPKYPDLCFLTAPMNTPIERIDPMSFARLMQRCREFFDYIFLDAPAGVDAGFRLVTAVADKFLLVTGPGAADVRDAARVGELLEIAGKDQVRLIVNRVNAELLNTVHLTIDDVMDAAGLPLTGFVPEDTSVTLAALFGRPLLKYAPKCPAAKAFGRIASRIQGIHEPIPMR